MLIKMIIKIIMIAIMIINMLKIIRIINTEMTPHPVSYVPD